MEDILALILIFGGGACIAMAFSPIGRAVADRIRGKSASAGGDVRTQLAEQREARRAAPCWRPDHRRTWRG